jgi:osmotically-inducible protein OsmY
MKPITATLLAAALSAAFASASAADAKPDQAQYRNATAKAASDYTAAAAKCKDQAGDARKVCQEEAKVARARAELNAVTEHNNTQAMRIKARTALANAEYALSKLTCNDEKGEEKTSCLNNAKSVHTAALADAKADREMRVATADSEGAITNTSPRDAEKRAAVEKCEKIAGDSSVGCLIDNKGRMTALAQRTENAVDKTKDAARSAADKTRDLAGTAAVNTDRTMERAAERTDRAAERAGDKTERVADRAGAAVSDTAITTKVKAGLFKEPDLKGMDIKVETEQGVVMLSGFVGSKSEAERAVRLAKEVEGVKEVKSAIKVK